MVKKSNRVKEQRENRGGFGSKIGFVLTAAGAAIGLGNIWKFPYMAGQNGGGLFFLLCLIFTFILGVPLLIGEMTLGRHAHKDAVEAYRSIDKRWGFVGVFAMLAPLLILSYYSIVGGWILKYFFSCLTFRDFSGDNVAAFNQFSSSAVEPIFWTVIFLALCIGISCIGIEKGIEKANKIMLPILFVLILVLAIYCMALPGAMEGVKFFFLPDFSKLTNVQDVFRLLFAAMSQVFFSVGIASGMIITYGSYLKQKNDIQKECVMIAGFDFFVAVMAALIVMPACFAFNTPVASGPGLIFETLPSIFSGIQGGKFVGVIFFLLIFFAAFSSAIAGFEALCTFLIDHFSIKRAYAAILVGIVLVVMSALNSLSIGSLNHFRILGMNLFDFIGFVAEKWLIPIGAFCMCVFIAYVWKLQNFYGELQQGTKKIYSKKTFTVLYKYVIPVAILFLFVMGMVADFS